MNRLLVLLDVNNLYYCISKKFDGARLDYSKLLEFISTKGSIIRTVAYGSSIGNQADRFLSILHSLGIETRFKEPLVYQNADGENRKADWDVGIAMDAARMLDTYDTLVLGSADGDMAELLKYIHERGRRSIVIGTRISRITRDFAGEAIEIMPSLLERPAAVA